MGTPYFKIKTILKPYNLVETSKVILQAVNQKLMLTYSYRLEVLFENNKALFTLCLNPILWFDVYLRNKDLKDSVKFVRKYVTDTLLTEPYKNNKISPFEVEHTNPISNTAFKLCKFGKKCKAPRCDRVHSEICNGTSETWDGHCIDCEFYVIDNYVIWEQEKYYMMY
ncbi:hypothetical protein RclHR1_06710014 [Rhizophagus clarus]|uniref:Uncharacterized protein n=1 Tax=Rhizophagus clarus TaxID=94130 RepID=A0A2Z6RU26_9GLOM|nr:hypothetical protein RclHR1_06710013 [Rhizophagus clarus]GBC06264.1 hypothetical protein RclHR1_06710014 [Rhizophagus clarus]